MTYSVASNPNGATIGANLALGGNRTFNVGDSTAANGNDLAITGNISGTGNSITKTGAGALVLSGTNTFSGGVNLSAGTLNINSASAIGNGTLTIGAGTVLDNTSGSAVTLSTNNAQTWSGNFTFTGTNNLSMGTGAVTLGTSVTTAVANSTLTIGGSIGSTASGITKTGNGTLVLAGTSNAYTGATVVSGGTLSVASLNSGSAVTIDGATLKFTNGANVSNSAALKLGTNPTLDASGTGTLTFSNPGNVSFVTGTGNTTLALAGTSTAANTIFAGLIDPNGGKLSLVKTGTGTWTLDGTAQNNYSGDTFINSGTLILSKGSNKNALGTGNIIIGDGTNTATLQYDPSKTTNQLFNMSSITMNSKSTFNLSNESDTIGSLYDGASVTAGYGNVVIGSGTLIFGGDSDNATFSGNITGTTGKLTKAGNGTQVLAGNLASSGSLTIGNSSTDIGALTLSGNNTALTGGVTVKYGTLNINSATALGTGTLTISTNTTIDNTSGGAVINSLNNAQTWNGNFTFAGSNNLNLGTGAVTTSANPMTLATAGTADLTIGGTVTLGDNLTIAGNGTGAVVFTGTLTDSTHAYSLTKTGVGALTLSGVNTYNGGTFLNGGTLNINNASALGSGTTTISAGTTIDNTSGGAVTVTNQTYTFGGNFSYGGTKDLDLGTGAVTLGSSTTIRTDTVAGATGNLAIGGVISGTAGVSLTKDGNGTVILYGNNTYSGTTVIAGGTLQVGNGGTTGTLGAASTISNAGTLLTNRSGTLTIGDTISGTGSVAITNASGGVTTLSGTNTYSGGTTVTSGTLKLSNVAGAGNAGAALILNGGTLDLATDTSVNAYNTTVTASSTILSDKATASSAGITHGLGTLSIGSQTLTVGVGSNVSSGNAGVSFDNTSLTGAATFNTVSAGSVSAMLTLGALNDSGAAQTLTFTGNGTTVIGNAASSLVNGTSVNVNGGTLALNTAGALGTLANVTVASGATTSIGANQTLGGLNGAGAVTLGANTLTVGSSNDLSSSYSGSMSGTGSLVKAGNGTLTLSGVNSYTGGTTVTTGTLIAANGAALGGSGSVTTVASGAALGLSGGIALSGGNIGISGAGVSGSGALYNASGSNSYTGNIVINADATISATTGTLTLGGSTSGNITLSSAATGNATVTFNAAAGAIIDVKGSITDKASTKALNVAYTGSGTLKFDNTDFYFGNLTIGTSGGNSTGTLQLNTTTALPTRNNSSLISIYSGTLDLNGFNNTAQGSLSLGGGAAGSSATIQTGAGTLVLNHDVTYDATNNANGATISGNLGLKLGSHKFTINDSTNAANDLTVSAAISDSGGAGEIDKYGNGTLMLSGNSSYTGLTNVIAGVVNVQNNGALGSTTGNTTVAAGASLQLSNATNGNLNISETLLLAGAGYNGNGALQNVAGNNTWSGLIALNNYDSRIQSDSGTLTIAGNVAVIGTVPGNAGVAALTVGGAGNVTITGALLSGSIGNISSVAKYDTGTLTLTNSNTIGGGAIDVHGGTLSVQNNYALGSTATTTTVDSGATIAFDSTAHGNLSTGIGLNTLNVSGTGFGNAGVIRNIAGSNQFNSAVNLNAASLITANAGTALTLAGNVTGANNASALTVGTTSQNGNVTISGFLNLNGATLNKNGTMGASNGVLTLSGGGSVGTVNLNEGRMAVTANTVNTGNFTAATNTSLLIASGGTVNVTGNATFNSHTLDGSAGTLKVNGNNSLTFNGTISASSLTLVLNGGSVGTNAAPLTVFLGGANITVGTIIITGDTILDFGNSAGTVLSSAALDIQNGAKVQVNNWKTTNGNTSLSTIWYATSTVNNQTLTVTPPTNQYPTTNTDLGQITFNSPSGSIGNTVTWVEDTSPGWFDHEIRPTPEPSTYGAILMSGCLGLLGFRAYRRRKSAVRVEG